MDKRAAPNERFHTSGVVCPPTVLWELASYYPAGSSVEAVITQSRHHVMGNAGTAHSETAGKVEKS